MLISMSAKAKSTALTLEDSKSAKAKSTALILEQPGLFSFSHPSDSSNPNKSPTSSISLPDPTQSPTTISPANCHNIRYSPTSKLLSACLQRSQVSITKVRTITLTSCNSSNPYNFHCIPLSKCTPTHTCASLPQVLNTESWVLPASGIRALPPPLFPVRHRSSNFSDSAPSATRQRCSVSSSDYRPQPLLFRSSDDRR